MAQYPIKMLKDENGTPFVPLVAPEAVKDTQGTNWQTLIDRKLEKTNIIAGDNITLSVSGNDITINSQAGGSGTSDYTDLNNKPKINNVELTGNIGLSDLGIINSNSLYYNSTMGSANPPTSGTTLSASISNFNRTPVVGEYVYIFIVSNDNYYFTYCKVSEIKTTSIGTFAYLNVIQVGCMPTKISAFTNDAGYLTEHQSLENKQDKLTASDGISIDENGNIKNTFGYQDNKLRLWTYCIPRATVNTLEELETALVSKFQEMLDAGTFDGVKLGTNLFVLSDPNGTDGAFTDYVGEYLINYVESSGSPISLIQISTIDKFFSYLSTEQSNNSLEMYDHAYITITTSYDESSSKVIVGTVSLNKPDEKTLNVLATDKDYTTPYMPLYNGSPTTKKYVDDNFINKNQIGVASGVASLGTDGKVPSSQLSNVVESGSNSNGSYIKYSDGTMICYKTVTGTVQITEQYYGYFYHTADDKYFNLGDYAMPFIERPICSITFRGGNSQWIGAIQNQSATHVGDLHVISVTSKAAGAYYDVIAIGRWK